ncbi:hypothetical protein KIN20_035360 [Parelaphostrongylus tenuis]|uniref:Uncharacterized protein n=1 Tax=Parelaphostrongylus tenuis TaxID=148309 RepID=A0AAD5REC3_PARTN|nr:hypothetical protein KIN20_035360 [Parelaphostrongylus tenuis]
MQRLSRLPIGEHLLQILDSDHCSSEDPIWSRTNVTLLDNAAKFLQRNSKQAT